MKKDLQKHIFRDAPRTVARDELPRSPVRCVQVYLYGVQRSLITLLPQEKQATRRSPRSTLPKKKGVAEAIVAESPSVEVTKPQSDAHQSDEGTELKSAKKSTAKKSAKKPAVKKPVKNEGTEKKKKLAKKPRKRRIFTLPMGVGDRREWRNLWNRFPPQLTEI